MRMPIFAGRSTLLGLDALRLSARRSTEEHPVRISRGLSKPPAPAGAAISTLPCAALPNGFRGTGCSETARASDAPNEFLRRRRSVCTALCMQCLWNVWHRGELTSRTGGELVVRAVLAQAWQQ